MPLINLRTSLPAVDNRDELLCELITARTGIPASRIYICFEDVPASDLGWNGRTFG